VFSRYAAKAREDAPVYNGISAVEFDLYTETLAQIYAEQGYYEQAKHIYSKLILAYPEKNAYFAALIQKIDEIN
jgi:tetratricopeptide (TPR) repeat protein